jgi:hypothetical protein
MGKHLMPESTQDQMKIAVSQNSSRTEPRLQHIQSCRCTDTPIDIDRDTPQALVNSDLDSQTDANRDPGGSPNPRCASSARFQAPVPEIAAPLVVLRAWWPQRSTAHR